MRFRALLALFAALGIASGAYGAALSDEMSVGTTTAETSTTFTQTFVWSFNEDQDGSCMEAQDFSKCSSMTRAFDAHITGANTAAKYTLYACDTEDEDDKANCRFIGGPYSEHSAVAMGAGMFTKDYGMVCPHTDPGSGDVATVTFSCAVSDYVYDEATDAWVASDKFVPNTSKQGTDDAMVYFNDFTHCDANLGTGDDIDLTSDWTDVDITGDAITADPSIYCVDAEPLGVVRMIADGDGAEGNSLLLDASTTGGFAFKPAADRTIEAEFRCTSSDWDAVHWFLGLYETTASGLMGAATGDLVGSLEYVGFHYNDDDDTAAIPATVYAGENNTETAATTVSAITALTDATYYRFKVRVTDTDNVSFFIDDVLVAKATAASAYTAPLYIALASVENEAVADTFSCDYVRATQTR